MDALAWWIAACGWMVTLLMAYLIGRGHQGRCAECSYKLGSRLVEEGRLRAWQQGQEYTS